MRFERLRRAGRYGAVGIAINVLAYLFFLLLLAVDMAPVTATGVTYVVAVCMAYVGHRWFTYRSRSPHGSDLPRFAIAHGVGLITSLASMALLVRHMPPELAQIFGILLAAAAIFLTLEITGFSRVLPGRHRG